MITLPTSVFNISPLTFLPEHDTKSSTPRAAYQQEGRVVRHRVPSWAPSTPRTRTTQGACQTVPITPNLPGPRASAHTATTPRRSAAFELHVHAEKHTPAANGGLEPRRPSASQHSNAASHDSLRSPRRTIVLAPASSRPTSANIAAHRVSPRSKQPITIATVSPRQFAFPAESTVDRSAVSMQQCPADRRRTDSQIRLSAAARLFRPRRPHGSQSQNMNKGRRGHARRGPVKAQPMPPPPP